MTATGPARPRGAQVGERAGVVAADQQRDDAGLDDRRDRRLDRRVAAFRVARDDRDVAVVDARQDVERADVEVGVVRPEHHARRAHGVGTEPAADAVGHAGVEGDADDREVDVLERPDVRQPGKGRRAREPRALQRVFGDVPRQCRECRRPAAWRGPRRARARLPAPCPRPRPPSASGSNIVRCVHGMNQRSRPIQPAFRQATTSSSPRIDERRVRSRGPREDEVRVQEHAAEGGDAGQQPDQQPEADGELAQGDERREQARVGLDDVLEEPDVPARGAVGTETAPPTSPWIGEPSPNSHCRS